MRKFIFVLAILMQAASLLAQPSTTIPASAVWKIPDSFVATAKAACQKSGSGPMESCLINQMTKAGAPADAVQFSHTLYKLTGEAGILTGFQKAGKVDIGWVNYPLHTTNIYGLILLNGQPRIVNAEDLKSLDMQGLQQSPQFQDLKNQYPKAALYSGDRDGKTWPNSQTGPSGGLQFIIGYPVRNGCPTCAHAGFALFTWNFDPSGKFTGTTFMGMTPAPLN